MAKFIAMRDAEQKKREEAEERAKTAEARVLDLMEQLEEKHGITRGESLR